ncbi:TRAP transporter small permease [Tranquillimonas alkanivorans]|uniref:TRAP transporter small permease protein n=1 Tax=Tranquillimonas alkanivorans TaxID=441119 RepID=A0A1I5S8E9_9RHOB|nr:TRAP transporter small permease [Tranquillimonas alkanivorans]SFP66971.1 TRAP-type C4-dicarboxylate transport system, small permease component [Tranquillimonas alkanivorans]
MLRRVERLLVDLSVISVLGLGLLITVSVILRAVFNSGVPDTIVMVRELMVAAVILPLAATTAHRAHIVVEFISNRLPPRGRDALIVFGSIFGLLALAPLLWAGWREMTHTFTSGGYFFGDLNLPKWPGRVIFLIGISFCWVRLALMVFHDLRAMRRGEPLAETGHGPEV